MAGVHTAIKIPKGTIKGRLANGLSYIIKRNAHPRNTTEFRLVMRIGLYNKPMLKEVRLTS